MIALLCWIAALALVAIAMWFGWMLYLSFVTDATEAGPPAFIGILIMLGLAFYFARAALGGPPL